MKSLLCVVALAGCAVDPTPTADRAELDTSGSGGIPVYAWLNAGTQTPATLEPVDANYDADYCELYVDSIADEGFSSAGATLRWLDVTIQINSEQPGTLGQVGMYTATTDGSQEITIGQLSSNGLLDYFETGFTYVQSSQHHAVTPLDYAFFVDVTRDDGTRVRLWQSNGGANFANADVFALPPWRETQGGTDLAYANDGSPIYAQKWACK